jgi:hypothetical protein
MKKIFYLIALSISVFAFSSFTDESEEGGLTKYCDQSNDRQCSYTVYKVVSYRPYKVVPDYTGYSTGYERTSGY